MIVLNSTKRGNSRLMRLGYAIRWDMLVQFRYGFYHAALITTVVWITALWFVSPSVMVNFLGVFLLSNLTIGTFFFVSALILFEKGENTIEALVVCPLQPTEYILSKVISLTILAILENFLIVLILFRGVPINYLVVFLSIVFMSLIYILFGIGFVVRYNDLTDFIFPSILIVIILELPIFSFFGLTGLFFNIIYFILPMQPMLVFTSSATQSLLLSQWIYVFTGTIFWLLVAFKYAVSKYNRFIIRKEVQ